MKNRINQRRKELNITQEELARRLGITISWLSKLETGKKQPTARMAIRIAVKLETTVSELFYG